MDGHWQKEVPQKDGTYWTATRSGDLNRPLHVVWNDGRLILAGGTAKDPNPALANNVFNYDATWKGWWWSEPLVNPPEPPSWDDGAPPNVR